MPKVHPSSVSSGSEVDKQVDYASTQREHGAAGGSATVAAPGGPHAVAPDHDDAVLVSSVSQSAVAPTDPGFRAGDNESSKCCCTSAGPDGGESESWTRGGGDGHVEKSADFAKRFGLNQVACRAVAVDFLVEFTDKYDVWETPTWKVVEDIIKPATLNAKECYVDAFAHEMPNLVGPPSMFMSHAWRNPFGLIVLAAVEKNRARSSKAGFRVWVDIFALNQHSVTCDLECLDAVVHTAKDFTLVLDPHAVPLSRCWCLFEIIHRCLAKLDGQIHVVAGSIDPSQETAHAKFVPLGASAMKEIVKNIDMTSSQAKYKKERDMIFKMAQELVPGGFPKINTMLRAAVMQEDINQMFQAAASGPADSKKKTRKKGMMATAKRMGPKDVVDMYAGLG